MTIEQQAVEYAKQFICSTDAPAQQAAWIDACTQALYGDDTDLRYMLGQEAAFERYLASPSTDDFDVWLDRNAWAAESYVPARPM